MSYKLLVDELTVDDLTVDEMTVDDLTWYLWGDSFYQDVKLL